MTTIEDVRGRILGRVLRIVALLGAIAYAPSLYASVASRLWLVAAVDSLAFALLVATALLPRIRYAARLGILVGTGLAIAGVVLFAAGPFGAGYIWIICAIFLASLLGSARLIVATVLASAAIMGGYAAYLTAGLAGFSQSLPSFLATAANLALACAILANAARGLIEGLEGAYTQERRLTERVSEELEAAHAAEAALHAGIEVKERLLRELNHRVHNNMQVILSLLAIEATRGDEGSIARLARRARALSIANDLVLADPEAGSADLHRLLASALMDRRAMGSGEERFDSSRFDLQIPVDRIAGLSVVLAEVLAALAELGESVEVGLEGSEDGERLAFRWAPRRAEEEASIAERLAADPVVSSLLEPGSLSFAGGGPAGLCVLSLRLPRA